MLNHLFYADDCVLHAPSREILSLHILFDCCQECEKQNKLVYNEAKTNCMVVNPQNMLDLHVPVFYLNGTVLDEVSKQKYLGIIL